MAPDGTSSVTAEVIEGCLALCPAGNAGDIEKFFELFLSAQLVVPARHQPKALSNEPKYPNDLTTILGVADKSRVVVPAFTRPEMVELWSGQKLLTRELSGGALLEIIPDDWWLVLNPGQEFEKEFSPWEITELRRGKEAIAELVAEVTSEETARPVKFRSLDGAELLAIKALVAPILRAHQAVVRVGTLVDEAAQEERGVCAWVVGVEVKTGTTCEDISAIKQEFDQVFRQHQIGRGDVSVWVGNGPDDVPTLGMFRSFEPVFIVDGGVSRLISRVKDVFGFR